MLILVFIKIFYLQMLLLAIVGCETNSCHGSHSWCTWWWKESVPRRHPCSWLQFLTKNAREIYKRTATWKFQSFVCFYSYIHINTCVLHLCNFYIIAIYIYKIIVPSVVTKLKTNETSCLLQFVLLQINIILLPLTCIIQIKRIYILG